MSGIRILFAALCCAAAPLFAAETPTAERDESALLSRIAAIPVVRPHSSPVAGFEAFGGDWRLGEGENAGTVSVNAGSGFRLFAMDERVRSMTSGECQIELFIPERKDGFSGINFKVSENGLGADIFNGYEVGFNPAGNVVMIGAHRMNFKPLKTVPFEVPVGRWFPVRVQFDETSFAIEADGKPLFAFAENEMSPADPLRRGGIALRSWQYPLSYRNLSIRPFDPLGPNPSEEKKSAVEPIRFPFNPPNASDGPVPESLAIEELPPFLTLVRAPLSRPNSVGNDLWQAQPTAPGAEIRLVDYSTGKVKTIFADPDGAVYDMNLSFDARTIYFSYKKFNETYWNLWKIGVDGDGLTRLTDGPFYDVSPCELPDGDIIFVSTRRFGHTVCQPGPASNLFRMKPDGSGVTCLSMNTLSDFSPQILPDGRVLFTRWEYVDRDLTYRQSLWTENPDGSVYQLYFGNTIRDVGSFLQARPFPGSDSSRVVATFAPHHNWPHGAIGVIDRSFGVEGKKGDGFYYLTQEFPMIRDTPHEWSYRDPFPLSEESILCAFGSDGPTSFAPNDEARKGPAYRIWLLNDLGERRLLYEDARQGCYYPIPLLERERPAVIPGRAHTSKERTVLRPTLQKEQVFSEWTRTAESFAARQEWGIPEMGNPLDGGDPVGTVVLVDVYNGLEPEVPRGSVKSIRIMEQVRKTVDLNARAFDQSPVMSYATYYAKRCWGEVPVEEDGSAHFYVPALREVYFQALDENGREIHRMTSAAQFMPGENLSCMGCHEPRETVSAAPAAEARRPAAAQRAPDTPKLPDWMASLPAERTNPRLDAGIVDFPSVVQPILDRYCIRCHAGENPDGGYDLSGGKSRYFSISYDNLLGRSQSYRQHNMENGEMVPEAAALEKPLVHFFWLLWTPSAIHRPYTSGCYASRLPDYFSAEHCGAEIPDAEKRRVWLWIDANAPYYGTFAVSRPATAGKRDLWSLPDENRFAPWLADGILPIYDAKCKNCHGGISESNPAITPQRNETTNWEGKFAWINFSEPENSALLTAHLAKTAGGRGLSTDANVKNRLIFRDTNDETYKKLLQAIQTGQAEAKKRPTADQPGFDGIRPEP